MAVRLHVPDKYCAHPMCNYILHRNHTKMLAKHRTTPDSSAAIEREKKAPKLKIECTRYILYSPMAVVPTSSQKHSNKERSVTYRHVYWDMGRRGGHICLLKVIYSKARDTSEDHSNHSGCSIWYNIDYLIWKRGDSERRDREGEGSGERREIEDKPLDGG